MRQCQTTVKILVLLRIQGNCKPHHVLLALVASLAVVSGLDRGDNSLCRLLLLSLLQFVVLVLAHPFTTTFSYVHGALCLALTVFSVIAQLLYAVLANSSSSVWLVELSAGCSLAIVGMTTLKMIMDLWELCKAIRRRYRRATKLIVSYKLSTSQRSKGERTPSLLTVDASDLLPLAMYAELNDDLSINPHFSPQLASSMQPLSISTMTHRQ